MKNGNEITVNLYQLLEILASLVIDVQSEMDPIYEIAKGDNFNYNKSQQVADALARVITLNEEQIAFYKAAEQKAAQASVDCWRRDWIQINEPKPEPVTTYRVTVDGNMIYIAYRQPETFNLVAAMREMSSGATKFEVHEGMYGVCDHVVEIETANNTQELAALMDELLGTHTSW